MARTRTRRCWERGRLSVWGTSSHLAKRSRAHSPTAKAGKAPLWGCGQPSFFESQLPVAVVEMVEPGEEREAEQIAAQRRDRNNHGGHIAHHDVSDFDHVEPHRRSADDPVGGVQREGVVAFGWIQAEPGRGVAIEGYDRRPGVDDEVEATTVD